MKILKVLIPLLFASILAFGQFDPHSRPLPLIGGKHVQATWYGLWIGTILDPTDTLGILTKTIYIPNGAGAGKVLTSDANGYMTLQTPSGGSVIVSDSATFFAEADSNQLVYPATYLITDEADGLFINTESDSTFSGYATVGLFVPNYEADGDNLGQLDANDIQTVDSAQFVIWADYYWVNNTGSPVTPDILDDFTLDGLTQLPKTAANGYLYKLYPGVVDETLIVQQLTNAYTGSVYNVPAQVTIGIEDNVYRYVALNNDFLVETDLSACFNNALVKSSDFRITAVDIGVIKQNSGKFSGILLAGSANQFSGNSSAGNKNSFSDIKLRNACRFMNNRITFNNSDGIAPFGYIDQFDNSQIINNLVSGEGSFFWDIHQGENCTLDSNTISSAQGLVDNIYQTQMDSFNSNVVSGDGFRIEVVAQQGFSSFSRNTFSATNGSVKGVYMQNSRITGCTLSTSNKQWRNVSLSSSAISNGSDIGITDSRFDSVNINLSGFTSDIINENISGAFGSFSQSITLSGATGAQFIGLVPTGYRITGIQLSGQNITGTGALKAGLSVDDSTLIPLTAIDTFNTGVVAYIGCSNAATANRSLYLRSNGSVSGTLQVNVQFEKLANTGSTYLVYSKTQSSGNADLLLGPGIATYNIPHGLGVVPGSIGFLAADPTQFVGATYSTDATNITITFGTPASAGIARIYWQAYR